MNYILRDVLFDLSSFLESHGIVNHRSESRAILAKAMARDFNRIHPAMQTDVLEETYNDAFAMAQRRALGEPLQLITGNVGFYNCVLKCEKGVFIPRIETELIVDIALAYLSEFPVDYPAQVLDLGTGTGAIPIALAVMEPRHNYYAVDFSVQAITLANLNAELNSVASKIEFLVGDYFEAVKKWTEVKYNVITANPPYIKTDDIETLACEVKDWDPLMALDGGSDGLDHYRLIASEIRNYLATDGIALFEIDPEFVEPLEIIFKSNDMIVSDVRKDFEGNPRVMIIKNK